NVKYVYAVALSHNFVSGSIVRHPNSTSFNPLTGTSMTKPSCCSMPRFLGLAVLVLAATSWAQQRPPILEKIAKTYGLDSFDQIEAVRYTFNLDIPKIKLKVVRTWEWEPKTGKVTYEGKDKDGKPVKVSYMRSQVSSQPEAVQKQIEPGFVNDNYWLL